MRLSGAALWLYLGGLYEAIERLTGCEIENIDEMLFAVRKLDDETFTAIRGQALRLAGDLDCQALALQVQGNDDEIVDQLVQQIRSAKTKAGCRIAPCAPMPN